jgi:hypothetical protein
MNPKQRAAYDQLMAAFVKYHDDDLEHLEYYYVAAQGFGNLFPGARRTALDEELDSLFEPLVVHRPLAAASSRDLDRAKVDLAHAENRCSELLEKSERYDPAKHRRLWAASRASWERYRSAWLELGTAMAGSQDAGLRRQVDVLVMRARMETLQTGWTK